VIFYRKEVVLMISAIIIAVVAVVAVAAGEFENV
jgi:hypothetical protein